MSDRRQEGGRLARRGEKTSGDVPALIAEILYIVSDLRAGRRSAGQTADALESIAARLSRQADRPIR